MACTEMLKLSCTFADIFKVWRNHRTITLSLKEC